VAIKYWIMAISLKNKENQSKSIQAILEKNIETKY